MKSELPAKHDERFVVVKAACGLSGNPGPADVDDKRTVRLQGLMESRGKRAKPVQVFISIHVAVVLLPHQAERRLVMIRSTEAGRISVWNSANESPQKIRPKAVSWNSRGTARSSDGFLVRIQDTLYPRHLPEQRLCRTHSRSSRCFQGARGPTPDRIPCTRRSGRGRCQSLRSNRTSRLTFQVKKNSAPALSALNAASSTRAEW